MGNAFKIGKNPNPLFNIWPYSLAWDLFYDEETAQNINPAKLIEVLDTLTEREKLLIEYRYKDFMTYNQIGKQIGRSTERSRQTIAKGLRKLHHPSRSRQFLTITKKEYADAMEDVKKERDEIFEENRVLVKILNDNNILINEPGIVERYKDPIFCGRKYKDIDISELELSVRSYNCLKRSGVETVADLMLMDEESMMKVRNLGSRSFDEIKKKMEDLNIPFLDGYPEGSVLSLNCRYTIRKKLVDVNIYSIEDINEYTDDDLISMGLDYVDLGELESAMKEKGCELKKITNLSESNLPQDIIDRLAEFNINTFDDIYSAVEFDDQLVTLEMLNEKQAAILKSYLVNRGRPLKRRPNPMLTKTNFNPEGNRIEDLGLTMVIVNIFKSQGIDTIDQLCSHTFNDIMMKLRTVGPANSGRLMNELSVALGRIDRHLKFTKEQIRNIKIMNCEISYFTKSILNLSMIYTIGDLLDYDDLDGLRKREGELHEIDKLISQAKKMLEDAV